MDGGAWWATVHGVTKSQTGLSDFTFQENVSRQMNPVHFCEAKGEKLLSK